MRKAPARVSGGALDPFHLPRVIDAHRCFGDPRESAQPRQFRCADDLIADQDVGDATPGEHLGLGHFLHALTHRAARHLQFGDDRGLMRLRVRPKFHPRGRQQRGHAIEVVFERIQIDQQRRRVDLVLTHAGYGGGRLQHRLLPYLNE